MFLFLVLPLTAVLVPSASSTALCENGILDESYINVNILDTINKRRKKLVNAGVKDKNKNAFPKATMNKLVWDCDLEANAIQSLQTACETDPAPTPALFFYDDADEDEYAVSVVLNNWLDEAKQETWPEPFPVGEGDPFKMPATGGDAFKHFANLMRADIQKIGCAEKSCSNKNFVFCLTDKDTPLNAGETIYTVGEPCKVEDDAACSPPNSHCDTAMNLCEPPQTTLASSTTTPMSTTATTTAATTTAATGTTATGTTATGTTATGTTATGTTATETTATGTTATGTTATGTAATTTAATTTAATGTTATGTTTTGTTATGTTATGTTATGTTATETTATGTTATGTTATETTATGTTATGTTATETTATGTTATGTTATETTATGTTATGTTATAATATTTAKEATTVAKDTTTEAASYPGELPTGTGVNTMCKEHEGMTDELRMHFLDTQNYRRSLLATGQVVRPSGIYLPNATNMIKLKLNCDLEKEAIHEVRRCPTSKGSHDKYGKNFNTFASSTVISTYRDAIKKAVTNWWKVVRTETTGPGMKVLFRSTHVDKPIESFTQIGWAATREIGCAIAKCSSSYTVICLYNPKGNIEEQPLYQRGTPCSACPSGTTKDEALGLCVQN